MFQCFSFVFVLTIACVSGQLINFQLPELLNNITINDISKLLRQIPLPNPLVFDGLPVTQNDVLYFLYTRQNQDVPVTLKRSLTAFSPFDPQLQTKFIIHGWLESANRSYYRGFVDAYMKRGDYNVIGVDWSRPAMSEYSLASRNTKSVGREIGSFVVKLNKATGVPLSQIHLLGHSLGAHTAGFAGKEVLRRTGQKVGRISALDAAGPLFETPIPVEKQNRLDKDDAEFVDCIHTDGGIFGMTEPIGHVDFYPNGGVPRQPGCTMINIRELSSRVLLEDMFCSHTRSFELYLDSINSKKLMGTECGSYQEFKVGQCQGKMQMLMGEDTDPGTRGRFYLDTSADRPFGIS